MGNWALEGVGFLSAEDTRGGSVWLFAIAHSVVGVAILIWEVEDVVTEKRVSSRGNHLGMFHSGSEVPKTQATCESIAHLSRPWSNG